MEAVLSGARPGCHAGPRLLHSPSWQMGCPPLPAARWPSGTPLVHAWTHKHLQTADCVAAAQPGSQGHMSGPRWEPVRQRVASAGVNGNSTAAAAAVSATAAGSIQQPDTNVQPPGYTFRFWHDEKRFKGTGEDSLAQRALLALGGCRMGGHIKSAPTYGPLGFQAMSQWELLWSPSTTATKAVEAGLRPGQLASAVPGSRCLTKKRLLTRTLHQAFGDHAFSMAPLTFELPSQVQEWLAHIRQQLRSQPAAARMASAQRPEAGSDAGQVGSSHGSNTPQQADDGSHTAAGATGQTNSLEAGGWWILKTAQHLGQGVAICNQTEAVKRVLARLQAVANATTPEAKREVRPFVVAQQYIPNPLLINGRKFGLRVWVLLTGVDPLRVYMHGNGLVLFSKQEYKHADTENLQSHLTNYAQNVDGDVWSLAQLQHHLGPQRYAAVLQQLHTTTALTFMASASALRQACVQVAAPAGSVFELFGLDFLLDSQDHPWLLEVNATPSLAVEHADEAVRSMIQHQKQGMVDDMFQLLRVPQRFLQPHGDQAEREQAVQAIQEHVPEAFYSQQVLSELLTSEMELRHAGGWQPLMPLMPESLEVQERGWRLSLTPRDEALRSWHKGRKPS